MSGHIQGIDRITYGVEDMAEARRFLIDWGVTLVAETPELLQFATLDGSEIHVRPASDPTLAPAIEPGPTLREMVWSVPDQATLRGFADALRGQPGFEEQEDLVRARDPIGLQLGLRVSRRHPVDIKASPINGWESHLRVDEPSPVYDQAHPVNIGHVVLFSNQLEASERFYCDQLGFTVSDRYPGRGVFLRCQPRGGHHDMFLLQTPDGKVGLNHIAFTVRDIHEVFGGGLHLSRCGWKTEIGPGRHPISSAYFWYVRTPCGALAEYYSNEDFVTENWHPRSFDPNPTLFAEWAVKGGIDGNTRRQTG